MARLVLSPGRLALLSAGGAHQWLCACRSIRFAATVTSLVFEFWLILRSIAKAASASIDDSAMVAGVSRFKKTPATGANHVGWTPGLRPTKWT